MARLRVAIAERAAMLRCAVHGMHGMAWHGFCMASWPIVAALQRCRDELPGRRHSVQSGHMVATEARRGARAQVPRPAPVVRETLCGQPSNPIPLPPLQPSAPPHPHPEARDLRAAVGATTRRVRVAAIRAAQCMLAAGLETSARPCMQPSA
eukprot:283965-Chlamydomonas_euryale.AAC.2